MGRKTTIKNARYRKGGTVKRILLTLLLIVITYAIIFKCFEFYILQSEGANLLGLIVFAFFFLMMTSTVIGAVVGIVRGALVIARENKAIKKINPYTYLRELPNSFGIGVASLLVDSSIENQKDIIAVILDLCARKYIKLEKEGEKYIVKVLKDSDDELLNNEKYILNLIVNNDLKNINYQEWYNYCVGDGADLEIYYHEYKPIKQTPVLSQEKEKRKKRRVFVISLLLTMLVIWAVMSENVWWVALLWGIPSFMLIYGFLFMMYYIIMLFRVAINFGKQAFELNYQQAVNNKLTRTEKGIEELYKMYALEAFLSDFGNFVDKKPEEVVLWDRYLAYAQVFGLTKEIMKTGHKEIVENGSFCIESIEDIELANINIE